MLKKAKRKAGIALKRARRRGHAFVLTGAHEQKSWILLRQAKERWFRRCGLLSILLLLIFLGGMVFSIVSNGYSAFLQTQIRLAVTLPQETAEETDYRRIAQDSLSALFPQGDRRALAGLLSKSAYHALRNKAPVLSGATTEIWLNASSGVDLAVKRGQAEKLSAAQKEWVEDLQRDGRLRKTLNAGFWTSADSQEPEQAGVAGSMTGSLFTILVCSLCAFPLGVATAVYLEEFARPSWMTELIEININNLASVPSIIYGLLGLSVYINFIGMPRSSALVGGLVLALLVLPVIVIATRNALRSVPKSIRFAALAMGATPVQVALHHTVLYALPGIMTGVILSIARALGETSPLLMIGMVAFIMDAPKKLVDPATTLPVQIYLWSNNPEAGFLEKTAAAIIVLLALLAVVNVLASWVRKKFEIKW